MVSTSIFPTLPGNSFLGEDMPFFLPVVKLSRFVSRNPLFQILSFKFIWHFSLSCDWLFGDCSQEALRDLQEFVQSRQPGTLGGSMGGCRLFLMTICTPHHWRCFFLSWLKAMKKNKWVENLTADTLNLGGGFSYFLFSSLLGEDSHFDYIIFFKWGVIATN